MKVILERVNESVHLVAKNDSGNEVHIDGSPEIGGENLGTRPMQLVLEALAGCASMDVLNILSKMKQQITSYSVDAEGNRAKDQTPAVFTEIQITFHLKGNVEPGKLRRAIQLSMDKYCSVSKMLESTVNITSGFTINGEFFE